MMNNCHAVTQQLPREDFAGFSTPLSLQVGFSLLQSVEVLSVIVHRKKRSLLISARGKWRKKLLI